MRPMVPFTTEVLLQGILFSAGRSLLLAPSGAARPQEAATERADRYCFDGFFVPLFFTAAFFLGFFGFGGGRSGNALPGGWPAGTSKTQ